MTLSVFLDCSSFHFLRQHLSLILELDFALVAGKLQEFSHGCFCHTYLTGALGVKLEVLLCVEQALHQLISSTSTFGLGFETGS